MATNDISLPAPAPDETTPYAVFGLAKPKAGKGDALAVRLLALVATAGGGLGAAATLGMSGRPARAFLAGKQAVTASPRWTSMSACCRPMPWSRTSSTCRWKRHCWRRRGGMG